MLRVGAPHARPLAARVQWLVRHKGGPWCGRWTPRPLGAIDERAARAWHAGRLARKVVRSPRSAACEASNLLHGHLRRASARPCRAPSRRHLIPGQNFLADNSVVALGRPPRRYSFGHWARDKKSPALGRLAKHRVSWGSDSLQGPRTRQPERHLRRRLPETCLQLLGSPGAARCGLGRAPACVRGSPSDSHERRRGSVSSQKVAGGITPALVL
jgi:hypothetical protein